MSNKATRVLGTSRRRSSFGQAKVAAPVTTASGSGEPGLRRARRVGGTRGRARSREVERPCPASASQAVRLESGGDAMTRSPRSQRAEGDHIDQGHLFIELVVDRAGAAKAR